MQTIQRQQTRHLCHTKKGVLLLNVELKNTLLYNNRVVNAFIHVSSNDTSIALFVHNICYCQNDSGCLIAISANEFDATNITFHVL